jgi:hypothetical protein
MYIYQHKKTRVISMDISVVDGCNKGLATWSWVCPPEIDKDVRADEGAREVAADPDLDNGGADITRAPASAMARAWCR